MSARYYQLTLFASRWHGFARWELMSVSNPQSDISRRAVLEKGWVWRGRGAPFITADTGAALFRDIANLTPDLKPAT